MNELVLTAIISGGASIIVCMVNSYYQARAAREQHNQTITLIEYKIEQLTKKVEKHNSVVERVYVQERKTEILDEKIRVANHRIEDLEKE